MNRLKLRLHNRGIHRFCRTVPMPRWLNGHSVLVRVHR